MKNIFELGLFTIVLLLGCGKDQLYTIIQEGNKTEVRISTSNTNKIEKKIMYSNWLSDSDASIRFGHTFGVYDGIDNPNGYGISASFEGNDVGSVRVSNITLNSEQSPVGVSYAVSPGQFSLIEGLFNDEIIISVEGGGDYSAFESSLDMPKKILMTNDFESIIIKNFNYEVFQNQQHSIRVADRNNFSINWNADDNNSNGVVVMLEWNGGLAYDGESKSTTNYKRNIELIDDQGVYSLNEFITKDVPQNAIVDIKLLRGDVDVIEIGGKKVKTTGYSQIVFDAICLL